MTSLKSIRGTKFYHTPNMRVVKNANELEAEKKKNRRIEVGPHATFYFENYDTMWHQIHEMIYIERGGEDQIPDELATYNPLMPQGRELIATVMFEIGDPIRRSNVLGSLGGIEDTMYINVDGQRIRGDAKRM